ncbi:MAG: SDR family oxidoreductase [Moraxellaceae bacterium]|jgi:NAD(P)-dependent dehydrogenase (short-subunit alcohol dehydrogenase family)|nr:MAG: SDR family oxidoreductase [Moraxellaceae bacterium]
MSTLDQFTIQDPRYQYDIPQGKANRRQEPPGLDEDLLPQADHGEISYRGTGRLIGRKALITGGDSGIGRAVAIAFAREGADIVITHLPEEEADAQKTLEYIHQAGRAGFNIAGDIADEKFSEVLVKKTIAALGSIDILVNNAGKHIFIENLEDLTYEQFKNTYEVNVFSMFTLTKAAVPFMPPGASIINTSSIQSYQPTPGLLDYASTKGAVTTFTKCLAKMLIKRGIRVNAVAPGPIWTPLQQSGNLPTDKLAHFGEQGPLGRPGQPAETAPAYVFLASQESSYITAEVIGVTGGEHLP